MSSIYIKNLSKETIFVHAGTPGPGSLPDVQPLEWNTDAEVEISHGQIIVLSCVPNLNDLATTQKDQEDATETADQTAD